MNSRERILKAIRFQETDRPPIFEKAAEIYKKTIDKFKWDAVLVWRPAIFRNSAQYEFIPYLKKYLGPDILVGSFIWNSAICIETIKDYMEFSIALYEEPEKLHIWAKQMLERAMRHAEKLIDAGCDMIDIPNDYAFNGGPFLTPEQWAEFTAPYMRTLVNYIKSRGVIVIMHSDGNIMPILDQIIDIKPHILQSLDPMAGMDIAEVKRRTYGKIALMGNVQCNLLQEGPDEEIIKSADYCIRIASPGGGFIYSSSNTIFKGLPLKNYELMVDYFHKHYE